MVKLIRLTSENLDGHIDSTFNQDIIVKPESQIALRNITMKTEKTNLVIDGSNDKITFNLNTNVTPSTERTVTLNHNDANTPEYNANNYKVLFQDIENKMNATLDVTYTGVAVNKEMGGQFRVAEDSNTRVTIECQQSPYNARRDNMIANIARTTLDDGSIGAGLTTAGTGQVTIFTKLAGQANDNNNDYMTYVNTPLAKGGGLYRAKVYRMENDGGADNQNGFVMGLTTTNPSSYLSPTVSLQDAQINYGVHLPNKTANYNTIADGVFTATAIAGENNVGAGNGQMDVIDFVVSKGRIECNIYRNSTGATPSKVIDVAYDYTTSPKLYPFIAIRGANCRLWKFKYQLDPYLEPADADKTHENTDFGNPVPPTRSNAVTVRANNFLDLGSQTLATYLGFSNQRIPVLDTNLQFFLQAVADFTFNTLDQTDNYMVLVDSLVLDSYDDYSVDDSGGQRKSILATIPNIGSTIAHEPNTQTFIDIKNNQSITLRNFKARVVRSDYGKIRSVGLLTLTLLIKDKNEEI